MQLVYTVCFLLFCCEYWISVTISDYSLRIYTAHNFNIITYQFCERRCPKFLEADYFVIMSFDTYSTGLYLDDSFNSFCGRRVLSPAVNGYPFFWLRHLRFDVFLSFNYRKRSLHLLNWGGPLKRAPLTVFSCRWHFGHELDSTQGNTPQAWTCFGMYMCPMHFLRALCKRQVMRSKQSERYSLHSQLLIKTKCVPWYHMIGMCASVHNCIIRINTMETSLSNKTTSAWILQREQKDVN